MSTVLDTIVQVSITSDSRTVSRQGFGTPLVLTYHTRFPESYRIYSSLSEMTADTFAPTDSAYLVAKSIFSQDPTISKIVVGKLASPPQFKTDLTITSAVQGQHVKFTVTEPGSNVTHDVDYPIPAAATTTSVATAIELIVEAFNGVDSSSAGAVVSITPTVPGNQVLVSNLVNATVKDNTAAVNYTSALSALQVENDDWYYVLIDNQALVNLVDVASWVETQKKLFFYTTSDAAELTGAGPVGTALEIYKRTVGIWAPNPQEHAGAGWVGGQGHKFPGSITWAYKEILGVTPKALTSTQRGFLNAHNINQYEPVAGLNVTKPGTTSNGRWIDEVHGIDALEADIKESVFAILANSDKVPFTQSGFDLIGNAILGSLKRFEGTIEQPGLITVGSSKVIMPSPASVNPQDKAMRILRNVHFQGQLAGAIHTVIIQGTLTNA